MQWQCVALVGFSWTVLLLEAAAVRRRHSNTEHPNDVLHNNTGSPCAYHESRKSTKPPYTSDTLVRIQNATFGRLSLNQSSLTAGWPAVGSVWRLICAYDPLAGGERGMPSVVLMNMSTSLGDYVQIKSTRLQGCSSRYRGFVFNKNSILIGYIPGPYSEGGDLELGYVCIRRTMQRLATNLLLNMRTLEYIQSRDMFERVATLLREREDQLMNITNSNPEIRELLNLAQPTPPHREQSTGSGEDIYN